MQGGGSTNSLSVIVSAEDADVVAETAQAVEAALAEVPGLANIASDLVEAAPEVQVRVDPNKAIGVGFTTAQVGAEIRTALTPTTVGLIQVGDADPVSLVFRLDAEASRLGRRAPGAACRLGRQGPAVGDCRRRRGRGPEPHHPDRRVAVGDDQRGHHERRHRCHVDRGPGSHRRAPRRTGRSRPAPRSRSAASPPSRPRRSAGCSPRWASRSCSST